MYPDNPHIVAVACDAAIEVPLPLLDLNDYDGVAQFVMQFLDIRGEPAHAEFR